MKRFLTVFLALALCVGVANAATPMGLSTNEATVGFTDNGSSRWYAIGNIDVVRVQIWSASTSDSVVKIEVTSDSTSAEHIYPVATITDPSSVGEYWAIPQAGFVRITVSSYVDGTVYANLEGFRGKEKVW